MSGPAASARLIRRYTGTAGAEWVVTPLMELLRIERRELPVTVRRAPKRSALATATAEP